MSPIPLEVILEDEYPDPELFFGFRFWDIRVGGGGPESTINYL